MCDTRAELLSFLDDQLHHQGDIAEFDLVLGLKNFKNQFLFKPSDTPNVGSAA